MVCVKVVQKWRDSAGTSSALFTWRLFSSIYQSTLRDIDKIISIIPKVHKILVCQLNLLLFNYYRPQRSWGKVIFSQASVIPSATKLGQGYIFTGVCDSVHRGGSASVHAGIPHTPPPGPGRHPPRTRYPPGPGTPPPPEQSILGDTVNEQAVCILLECNLVSG